MAVQKKDVQPTDASVTRPGFIALIYVAAATAMMIVVIILASELMRSSLMMRKRVHLMEKRMREATI